MAAKWHAAAIDIHLSSKRFAKSGNSHDTPREEDRTRSGSVLVYRWLLHFHSLLQNATVPKTIFAADRWAINADWCLGFLAGDRRWWLRARDRDMDCQRSINERAYARFLVSAAPSSFCFCLSSSSHRNYSAPMTFRIPLFTQFST